MDATTGIVEAVSCSPTHSMRKHNQMWIELVAGLGVQGDTHAGAMIQHRSRWAKNRLAPNLRQVHLIHAELHEELRGRGFEICAGQMGENVTTRGVDLLALPTGARLRLGDDAIVEITGLRNPCIQLNKVKPGLMDAVLDRDERGNLIRKAGIMGIVVAGGTVRPGDPIVVELPPEAHEPLKPV
jgi:hypothetical protein